MTARYKLRILLPIAAAFVVLAAAGQSAGCASAPASLGPQVKADWYKTRVVKSLDVVRDIAVDANAQTPPLIPTATTRKVVNFHESALKIIGSTDAGWRAAVGTGLDELMNSLTPAEKNQLGPYIALVKTLLQEVGTDAANVSPGYRLTMALEEVLSLNPALLAIIEQEAPAVIGYFKMMFHKANPNDPPPTDAEVEAAYHQVLSSSLQKDEDWKRAHPE